MLIIFLSQFSDLFSQLDSLPWTIWVFWKHRLACSWTSKNYFIPFSEDQRLSEQFHSLMRGLASLISF